MTGNDVKMTPAQAAQEASARLLLERFGDVVKPWEDAGSETREGWEIIAQAAIAVAPACPCGGMPGTACGDLIVQLRADIVQMQTDALNAGKAQSEAVAGLTAEVARLQALLGELIYDVPAGLRSKWRQRAGLPLPVTPDGQ